MSLSCLRLITTGHTHLPPSLAGRKAKARSVIFVWEDTRLQVSSHL
jgi:hypothetical protein